MASGQKLSRELNIWETIGISVALMAPSMAANINPQGTVGSVGRAVPLAFALATVGAGIASLDHPLFEGGGSSRPPKYSKLAK